jgi:hypothetical protein
VGDEEASSGMVDVRSRDGTRHGKMQVDEFSDFLLAAYPQNVPGPKQLG